MPFPTVRIFGLDLYAGSLDALTPALTAQALDPAAPRASRCISAADAHVMVHAHDDPAFGDTLRHYFLHLPDGVPVVWLGRLLGGRGMRRCSGPDLFARWLRETAATPLRHYLCGGAPGVAEALADTCRREFGNPNVTGTYCPPFRPMAEADWNALADDIARSGADIVWVGISTPKQHFFAAELARRVQVHYLLPVGAAFDYHTGRTARAPGWMARAGLEWLYRVLQEPRRLLGRYLHVVPRFLWLGMGAWLRRGKAAPAQAAR